MSKNTIIQVDFITIKKNQIITKNIYVYLSNIMFHFEDNDLKVNIFLKKGIGYIIFNILKVFPISN